MIYAGAYRRYQLYSITEQDIVLTGGAGASRYIKNAILVFLPDIEKPELGTELIATETMKAATEFIDDISKKPSKEIIDAAILESQEREKQNLFDEEDRRKRERERYEREKE